MFEVGHASHTGLRREFNEDSYWADTDLGLFLVVDGMGGCGRGEVAAACVRDALVDAVRSGRSLELAIRGAAESIASLASSSAGNTPTGATLALLKIESEQFAVASIGDARVYRWQCGMQQPLCSDEPAAAADREPSAETSAAGLPRPKRNRITQALGITPAADLRAEAERGALERGMQFLLCSDGLSDELGDAQIATILARTELAAQECVDHLLLAALNAGGRDNISLVLVRVT